MSFELGGRADKKGNEYEINCIIYEMLKVLNETNYSVVIEALGKDEVSTDILVTSFDGEKEHQQCKARNGSQEYWRISDLKGINVFTGWRMQLDRGDDRQVALVSPLGCSFLVDLCNRARNTSGRVTDFYEYQIKKSNKEFQNFYKGFCEKMGLGYEQEEDIRKSISYLKRIYYKQMSEYELTEYIDLYIQYLFQSKKKMVYDTFVSLVVMEDILGQEITQPILKDYFTKQGIVFRLRDGDKRVASRLDVLNQEYRENFRPLLGELIQRKEFDDCIRAIEDEKSVIIVGNAGYGKSGCTEAILDYCEKRKLPHVAVKLDRRTPHGSCEIWGQELGLLGSMAYALHCLSRDENSVIILDQLDALRWTQANSSEALGVCMELIRQVNMLNDERKRKIIIVFVCRTYDLENDNNINALFKGKNARLMTWEKITIGIFDRPTVRKVIGKSYDGLSEKLKNLLQIPGNLFIWHHLDQDENSEDCLTTSRLVERWFKQICEKSVKAGLKQGSVQETVLQLVDTLDRTGRLYVPRQMLTLEMTSMNYLKSSEMITAQNNKVGFAHQSILDCFISQKMMEKYFEGRQISEIIGEKSRQNPARRYQIQMFLQSVLEYDSGDFLTVGEKMFFSEDVRYYVKYLFFEILGQIQEPDETIRCFIVDNCENGLYGSYLLNNVIWSRKAYINVLRDQGVLDRWFRDTERKEQVFQLLQSIHFELDAEDARLIERHAFIDERDDLQFLRCFQHDITQECEEMFELRMKFYEHYPEKVKEAHIAIKPMMEQCGTRTIRLISFWMEHQMKDQGRNVYYYEEELNDKGDAFLVCSGEFVLDKLLPWLPQKQSLEIKHGEWSNQYMHMRGLERVCVELVKKANVLVITQNPEHFWDYYSDFLGKGYYVFNEVILDGLTYLPLEYSGRVINYLCEDLDNNVFDYTSGAEDSLGLVKKVLEVHAVACDKKEFRCAEKAICEYISPDAVQRYRDRIEQNRRKDEYGPVYWSFWGELQYELLRCLPEERLSKQTKELLEVLKRKFGHMQTRYRNRESHFGIVKSPVSGKNISKAQWFQIMTNCKLRDRTGIKGWEVTEGFIESSCRQYASDFQTVVRQKPQEMIELILDHRKQIFPAFIDSLFFGVSGSEKLEEVDHGTMEKMLLTFPCNMNDQRAHCFCEIIEKMSGADWSLEIIEQLEDIALYYHESWTGRSVRVSSKNTKIKSSDELYSDALNSVRGKATRAIEHLLWEDKGLFLRFKNVIEKLTEDEDSAVRFSSLFALRPSFCIDREWAKERILQVYESDIRVAIFYDTKKLLFLLYSGYRERVLKIVSMCFTSEDKKLVEIGGHIACEFYIQYNEFEEVIMGDSEEREDRIKAILQMAVIYLQMNDLRLKAQKIILHYRNIGMDVRFPLTNMFDEKYLDAKRDKEFLREFVKSRVGRQTVWVFVSYLKKSASSIVEYADIIIGLCENVLYMDLKDLNTQWGVEDEISKLIMVLYDETADSGVAKNKQTAEKCLELWDIMFERQLGTVREISRMLMER